MPPKHTRAETVEYVAKILKQKTDTAYDVVKKQAKAAGYHVYPLIMGLAKNMLGLGKKKRGPGRPRGRGRAASNGRGITGDLVRAIDRMQGDAAAMRSALREI